MRLKSERLQNDFERIGAIKISNFLKKEDLLQIKELYSEMGLTKLGGIYTNVKDQGADYNNKVDSILRSIFEIPVKQHFEDYQIGGGAFLIKGTGENSHSSLHQDWNVVDENKYQSAAIFCPIQDVDEENGCLKVIGGSHKWFRNIRSFHYPSQFLNFDQINKGMLSLPVKAGDAVVFRHNVFHGSKPNLTNYNRVAASVSIASKEAQYLHYFKEDDFFKIIKANALFFNESVAKMYEGKKVDLEEIGKILFEESKILTLAELQEKYIQVYPPSVFERVKKLFTSR